MSTASQSDVSTHVNQGYDILENLWNEVKGTSEIRGLDSSRVPQVKEHISRAYEAMREAKMSLGTP